MPSQGIVQRMEQIARSVVRTLMVELLTVTPGLLVLLYHPVVRHVVEELLHFEIRQSRDFRKASREDDFLRALGDNHRLSLIFILLESCFERILAASVPADVQFLGLGNKSIYCLFSHQDIVFRSIQHFLRIKYILNNIKAGIVYGALAAMAFVLRYGNQFLRFIFLDSLLPGNPVLIAVTLNLNSMYV